MFSKALAATAVALAASTASAQLSSKCNPLKEDGCSPNPAFGRTFTCPLTQDDCGAFEGVKDAKIKFDKDMGAVFTITEDGQSPTINTKDYIFYGRVDIDVRAAPGKGIVSSIVLLSDTLDEIDIECLGGDNNQVQSNWFDKGQAGNYDRNMSHSVHSVTGEFHTYSFEWTSTSWTWSIDGAVQRTLTDPEAKAKGFALPQSPMHVRLGIWAGGGKDSPEGVANWAGGRTDFSQAPFIAYYKNLKIVDYAGKDQPANGGVKQYVYGDKTGTSTSIKVVKGDKDIGSSSSSSTSSSGGSSSSSSSSSTSGSKPSSSTTASSTSTSSGDDASTTLVPSNNSTATSRPSATSSASGSGASGASGTSASSRASPVSTSSAAHGAAVLGSVLLAGAGAVLAQLLL